MRIRKVGVFHNGANVGSAWCCAEGIIAALKAEGYETLDCGSPVRSTVALDLLAGLDLIILAAPEWYFSFLLENYGEAWSKLPMLKIAWYSESFEAHDGRDLNFEILRPLFDHHYFPGVQDAIRFGATWLPFGVDTAMFAPSGGPKKYGAAFLGSIYPKRQAFLDTVTYPIQFLPPIKDAVLSRSIQRLAAVYSETTVFVNLPAWSRVIVSRVTEVLACKTFLLTPRFDHVSAMGNMAQFTDGKHLVYYDPSQPREFGELIDYYLHNHLERERIAEAGFEEVRANHTLRGRIRLIIGQAEALRAAA